MKWPSHESRGSMTETVCPRSIARRSTAEATRPPTRFARVEPMMSTVRIGASPSGTAHLLAHLRAPPPG
eukprot:CAMPEP_0206291162 /NCGR_PEP_ID=MMETSP0106_2-20121207/2984_1 /ASSEMBLY_ACC=CAM_ASM_000206 /TAXON_ID=81532 /ORGANISM="Acanthoeca-like sp., Strain 10tr" /LENGTH=68 /DNA_ID=CAMNT_0053721727 /DNA_START=469 /DNA_END=671 /DNA_ORIENTATION=-